MKQDKINSTKKEMKYTRVQIIDMLKKTFKENGISYCGDVVYDMEMKMNEFEEGGE